jgi:enediyne biosynthesis protein E4
VAVLLLATGCSGGSSDRATQPVPPAAPVEPQPNVDGSACWTAPGFGGAGEITFSDVTSAAGLIDPLVGMYGHAAAWGDVNEDGWSDLFVGTFADRPTAEYQLRGAAGPAPDRLLFGAGDGFHAAPGFPPAFGRSSGAAFADLDGDHDADLVVSRNREDEERADRPTEILRNEGGRFSPVKDGGVPPGLVGRSVAILDYDGDARLDLFIAEDRWTGGSSVLLRNEGGLRFSDATEEAGLPVDVHGLGVAAADVTADGRDDLFVAGSNRLFVAQPGGTFREADGGVFQWETYGPEDDVSGVAVGDLNRDGRPDLVLGHHYNSTLEFDRRVPIRVYLHRGLDDDGTPRFDDVTDAAGLEPLPTKAPHVEIVDLDNDGWPDILTTASSADGTRPAVFRHLGLTRGVPRFSAPDGLGDPNYWVTGPVQDVDRDGRLDVLLVAWEPAQPTLLLRNETAGGNWLRVSVGPDPNGGLGARVSVYREGGLGDPAELLGVREIVATQGFAAGVSPEAHFGLGDETAADLRIDLPGGERVDRPGVPANRFLRFPSGCG